MWYDKYTELSRIWREYKEGMSNMIFEKLTFVNLTEEDVENNLLFILLEKYW